MEQIGYSIHPIMSQQVRWNFKSRERGSHSLESQLDGKVEWIVAHLHRNV